MALGEAEVRAHAERIIRMHNDEFEFCLVYEDDELEDVTEDDWRAIYDAMYAATVKVEWSEAVG